MKQQLETVLIRNNVPSIKSSRPMPDIQYRYHSRSQVTDSRLIHDQTNNLEEMPISWQTAFPSSNGTLFADMKTTRRRFSLLRLLDNSSTETQSEANVGIMMPQLQISPAGCVERALRREATVRLAAGRSATVRIWAARKQLHKTSLPIGSNYSRYE